LASQFPKKKAWRPISPRSKKNKMKREKEEEKILPLCPLLKKKKTRSLGTFWGKGEAD